MPVDLAELQVLQSAALLLYERLDDETPRAGLEGDIRIGDTLYRVKVEMAEVGH